MARICQLHADLRYYLCMKPVDMRKQFRGLQGIISEEYNRCLTQDEAFFGACKVKGKNPERWLTYVLNHIGTTKEEDLYKLLPEFWEDIN